MALVVKPLASPNPYPRLSISGTLLEEAGPYAKPQHQDCDNSTTPSLPVLEPRAMLRADPAIASIARSHDAVISPDPTPPYDRSRCSSQKQSV